MRFIDRPRPGCSALKLTGFVSSPQLDGVKPPIKPHLSLRCPRPCSLEPDFSSRAWLLTDNAHALYVLWSFIVWLSRCFGSSRAHFIAVFSPNPARQKLVKLVCHRDAPPVPFPGSRPVFCKSSPPGRLLELFLTSSKRWFYILKLKPLLFQPGAFLFVEAFKASLPTFLRFPSPSLMSLAAVPSWLRSCSQARQQAVWERYEQAWFPDLSRWCTHSSCYLLFAVPTD